MRRYRTPLSIGSRNMIVRTRRGIQHSPALQKHNPDSHLLSRAIGEAENKSVFIREKRRLGKKSKQKIDTGLNRPRFRGLASSHACYTIDKMYLAVD